MVIAGANGSGKTTLALELQRQYEFTYLNPDEIAREESLIDPQAAAFRAARRFLRERNQLVEKGHSFGLETTLSGKTIARFFDYVIKAGYRVVILYAWLDDPEFCIERIRVRVASGGHHIPDESVRRRYYRSHVNFWQRYRIIADQWVLFYNGYKISKVIAAGWKKRGEGIDSKLYERYRSIVNESRAQTVHKGN